MANSIYNMQATKKLYEIVDAACEEGRYPDDGSGLFQMQADATARDRMIVRFANDMVRDIMDAIKRIGIVTADVAITAGTRSYTLASVQYLDVMRLEWQDPGERFDHQPIKIISERDVLSLPYTLRQDDFRQPFPLYASVDPNGANLSLSFYPMPDQDATATLFYRAAVNKFTTLDLVSGTATVVCPIPDDMLSLMGKWLAAEFHRIIHGAVSNEYAGKRAEATTELEKWQRKLSRTPAEQRDSSMYNAGYPRDMRQERAWSFNQWREI